MKVTLTTLLEKAEKENSAVGCFTVPNMEILMAAVAAAEEKQCPIVIQIAEGRLAHSPLHYLGPMMVRAAEEAKVPICVHLDHGLTEDTIQQALDLGFSSVMYDGSRNDIAENIARTQRVTEIAKRYGATVEAEIGAIGGKEATDNVETVKYSSLADVKRFSKECDVDALAVAIGNAHGHYKGVPKLNMELLEQLAEASAFPLVLHGGSGITAEQFRACIGHGIRKINIATSVLDAYVEGLREAITENPSCTFYQVNEYGRKYAQEEVKRHITVFNNKEVLA